MCGGGGGGGGGGGCQSLCELKTARNCRPLRTFRVQKSVLSRYSWFWCYFGFRFRFLGGLDRGGGVALLLICPLSQSKWGNYKKPSSICPSGELDNLKNK